MSSKIMPKKQFDKVAIDIAERSNRVDKMLEDMRDDK